MACEFAELRLYDVTGVNRLATLPVSGLEWSDDVGGYGGVKFTASTLAVDPDALTDCVVKVATPLTAGAEPTEITAYAVRGNGRNPVARTVDVSGNALLPVWSTDAVIRPEFGGDKMPRGSGEQRGLSWVSSAYDPATDPDEPWDLLSVSSRTTMPTEPAWPTGSGAQWITATTVANGLRKLFRAWLVVPNDYTLIRTYFSSDESATIWVGGEALIQTDNVEVGKKETHKADRVFMAGTYAVAVDTATHVTPRSEGGDGVDPILVAIAQINGVGDALSWLLVSDDSWVATRRQITGPGSAPPGPTPGALVELLATEAADRGVTTWVGLTRDFDGALDSDGNPWTTTEERIARYSFDTYLTFFDGLGDVACDMRITPELVLQARVFEGVDLSTGPSPVILRPSVGVKAYTETVQAITGTVADAYTVDGWITVTDLDATVRREFVLSLGTAPSLSQGERVASEAIAEFSQERSDASIEFIATANAVPYQDFRPGDTVLVEASKGVYTARRILSLGGKGTSPVTWTAELGEANA